MGYIWVFIFKNAGDFWEKDVFGVSQHLWVLCSVPRAGWGWVSPWGWVLLGQRLDNSAFSVKLWKPSLELIKWSFHPEDANRGIFTFKTSILGRSGFTKSFCILALSRHWWKTKTAKITKHWQNFLLVHCFATKSSSWCHSWKDFFSQGAGTWTFVSSGLLMLLADFFGAPIMKPLTPWALLAMASPETLFSLLAGIIKEKVSWC